MRFREHTSPERTSGVHWWRADIADGDAVTRVVSSIEPHLIFNLAGESRAGREVELVRPTLAANLAGTVNVLLAAQRDWMPPCCSRGVTRGTGSRRGPGPVVAVRRFEVGSAELRQDVPRALRRTGGHSPGVHGLRARAAGSPEARSPTRSRASCAVHPHRSRAGVARSTGSTLTMWRTLSWLRPLSRAWKARRLTSGRAGFVLSARSSSA